MDITNIELNNKVTLWIGVESEHTFKAWDHLVIQKIVEWCKFSGFGLLLYIEDEDFDIEDCSDFLSILIACDIKELQISAICPLKVCSKLKQIKNIQVIDRFAGYATLGWDKCIQNFDFFDEIDLSIAPWAISEISTIINSWKSLKRQKIKISPDLEFFWDNSRIAFFADECKSLILTYLMKFKNTGMYAIDSLLSFLPKNKKTLNSFNFTCISNGDIYPWTDLCHLADVSHLKIGNVFTGIQDKIIESLYSRVSAESLTCYCCLLFKQCNIRNPGLAYKLTGSIINPSGVACRIFQTLIFSFLSAIEDYMNEIDKEESKINKFIAIGSDGTLYSIPENLADSLRIGDLECSSKNIINPIRVQEKQDNSKTIVVLEQNIPVMAID